jgi:hypothetical protein
MTKQDAISMIEQYAAFAPDAHIGSMAPRMGGDDFSEGKAMRWLGWVQGVLVERGVYDLEDVKGHSRTRIVTAPASGVRLTDSAAEIHRLRAALSIAREEVRVASLCATGLQVKLNAGIVAAVGDALAGAVFVPAGHHVVTVKEGSDV